MIFLSFLQSPLFIPQPAPHAVIFASMASFFASTPFPFFFPDEQKATWPY